jgi:hypothetical protein
MERMMPDLGEYTVRHYTHGVAIFGSVPVDDMVRLTKQYKRKYAVMDTCVASALGATLAMTSKTGGEAWRKEIDAGPESTRPWLQSGDTGTSSLTIYSVLANKPYVLGIRFGADVPHDPDDFGRCHRLLKRYPEWRDRLGEVAAKYPKWGPMVREWGRMTELYIRDEPTGRSKELYELMRTLEDEGRSSAAEPATA